MFEMRALMTHFDAKLSATTDANSFPRQILALVNRSNEILFRYTRHPKDDRDVVFKLLTWFNEKGKEVQDICFDVAGKWLLVLCDDNTLHVIPALAIVDHNQLSSSIYSNEQITSYIIPFVGPHECPNPRTCPNNFYRPPSVELESSLRRIGGTESEKLTLDELYSKQRIDKLLSTYSVPSTYSDTAGAETSPEAATGTSSPCPYPTAVVWWQTSKCKNRAIIGYSDGSISIVSLTSNCPLIAYTLVSGCSIEKLRICRDACGETTTLLIHTTKKSQWKLLLEHKKINFTYPGDTPSPDMGGASQETEEGVEPTPECNSIDSDWQIVITKTDDSEQTFSPPHVPSIHVAMADEERPAEMSKANGADIAIPKLFPSAMAKLTSLKNMGAKKIGALKQILYEAKAKNAEAERPKEEALAFEIIEPPCISPEILTMETGPLYIVQYLDKVPYLTALHHEVKTLSVHTMDINLRPIHIYDIPESTENILLTRNLVFAVHRVASEDPPDGSIHACSILSRVHAETNLEIDPKYKERSQVVCFPFSTEKILNIHRLASLEGTVLCTPLRDKTPPREDQLNGINVMNYVKVRSQYENSNEMDDAKTLQAVFPAVHFEKCLVVTDKNVYCIELSDKPENIFMAYAVQAMWAQCEYFCDIFNISYTQCIEYVGDELLRQKKVTQALITYNMARIPPIKTAMKLAMCGESYALLHLCAMALKSVHLLKSVYPTGPHMVSILKDAEYRNVPHKVTSSAPKVSGIKDLNTGVSCSDFCYQNDEVSTELQMPMTSQFHLSNLMFLTLCEKTLTDKNFMPLWNFIASNTKFHIQLSSAILAQSGLYSSAILLARTRGACLEVFTNLVAAIAQEFGTDINYLLYNLSDEMFMECITYLPSISIEYFNSVKNHVQRFSIYVLEKLAIQLNPFSEVFRPIVSNPSIRDRDIASSMSNNMDSIYGGFYRALVEAYIVVVIRLHELKGSADHITNALSNFFINHEENPFGIRKEEAVSLSAGFAHSVCVIDGAAYIWGSPAIPYAIDMTFSINDVHSLKNSPRNISFLSDLQIRVYSAQCGRTHTLLYTNNGLYAMGANQLGQLGVGSHMSQSLHPMLVRTFERKVITKLVAGQYHNAAVADGLLYTWGWGVYGQLGHGTISDEPIPKVVEFFSGKKIEQICLGHAHTLVLCRSQDNTGNVLYVFGSNYFGQLGVGHDVILPKQSSSTEKNTFTKSLAPIELKLEENIRLIHTKYFCSFAVTDENKLYTWGSSPQALRLINQARKRAKASQRAEMMKTTEEKQSEEKQSEEEAKGIPIKRQNSAPNISTVGYEATISPKRATYPQRSRHRSPLLESLNIQNVEPAEKKVAEAREMGLEEWTEHLVPSEVDTSQVDGFINQVSSGLYHFALRVGGALYTWGKNLEKQLGNEAGRADVPIPAEVETVQNVLNVECGADFTLALTVNGRVMAFGNNNQGQCAKDTERGAIQPKWVRLKISKRHIRLPDGSLCVETPFEVALPRPKICMDESEAMMRLKNLPAFHPKFLKRSHVIHRLAANMKSGGTTVDSNLNDFCTTETSLEAFGRLSVWSEGGGETFVGTTPTEASSEEFVYSPSISECGLQAPYVPDAANSDFLHYCLFMFHGIYDGECVATFCQHKQFIVRLKMLNYKYVEAFRMCLAECCDEQKAILLFEHFTKDENLIPIHMEDVKIFVQEIFVRFIVAKWDVKVLEEYFLANLDFYIIQLAYVLFFCNNNTELERNALSKYKFFFGNLKTTDSEKVEKSELIFENVSSGFNIMVCQRLIELYDRIEQSH
uniref:E3 ubiquitin-protein ligase herc2 n=1 Tax=Phlebotomus kandelakii TaxID=1109342 RepID=A0A6B2ENE5_9DIPT